MSQNVVNRTLILAHDFDAPATRARYIQEMAFAFHTVMDSTSPAHVDESGWPVSMTGQLPNIHSPLNGTGIEGEQAITPEIMEQTTRMLQEALTASQNRKGFQGCQRRAEGGAGTKAGSTEPQFRPRKNIR